MQHSATTDTLDSVYLDPPLAEQDVNLHLSTDELNIDKMAEIEETGKEFGATLAEQTVIGKTVNGDSVDDKASENIIDETLGASHEVEGATAEVQDSGYNKIDSPPSLSKYFGKETGADDPFATDVFDTLCGTQTELMNASDSLQSPGEIQKDVADIGDEIRSLSVDDYKDNLNKTAEEALEENANNNHRKSEELNVDFDLAIGNDEPVETPVDIEEKDNFESFTAYTAESEALDALGMSPANPSFMTEKNISDYFRQTSNTDSTHSLGIGRQMSVSSGQSSNLGPGPVTENLEEGSDNGITTSSIPQHVQLTESSLPAPDMTHGTMMNNEMEAKGSGSVESTPVHHPVFPPSTTLSPVDSPVHQPSFNKTPGKLIVQKC